MPKDSEEKFDTGLAVLEMTRTEGWKWLEQNIREELRLEYNELRDIEIAGKTAEQIASDYLQHRANVKAYEKVLAMAENAIAEKDEAAEDMRGK
jgi:uncharacterized protein YukE